jgi:hypothetical protein
MGNDADARYLAKVHEDVERVLGPGIEILGLDWRQGTPVSLTLRYQLGTLEGETVGEGESVIAAHAELRKRLVIDRLTLGFAALTEPSAYPGHSDDVRGVRSR